MDDGSCAAGQLTGGMSSGAATGLAHRLKALADPARLRLLSLIADSPSGAACVCDLTESLGLSQPTVSHHLRVLVDAGFLDREKRGVWAWYSAQPGTLAAALDEIPGVATRVWGITPPPGPAGSRGAGGARRCRASS